MATLASHYHSYGLDKVSPVIIYPMIMDIFWKMKILVSAAGNYLHQ